MSPLAYVYNSYTSALNSNAPLKATLGVVGSIAVTAFTFVVCAIFVTFKAPSFSELRLLLVLVVLFLLPIILYYYDSKDNT